MGRGKNRGRRKRKLEQQSESARREVSDEEVEAAIAEFEDGADRVGTIMGAALVEIAHDDALVTSLKDTSNVAKLFDDVKGPFNTFYAKTLAARALGLIDADQED